MDPRALEARRQDSPLSGGHAFRAVAVAQRGDAQVSDPSREFVRPIGRLVACALGAPRPRGISLRIDPDDRAAWRH
jgi:hypothetical protein